MVRLGGQVIPIDDLTSDSKKGETLQDAIKSIENFVDIQNEYLNCKVITCDSRNTSLLFATLKLAPQS